nr:cytochrome c biogenesis protein CcdC [Ammoniphilus oxalaticus]
MFTVIATIGSILMAFIVLTIRLRRANRPTSMKQIILPPLFMSTGSMMFLYPPTRVDAIFALESLFMGMILSIPLILTSKFELRGDQIFMKRSKAFAFILIGLLLVRLAAKVYVGEHVSLFETGGLFYLLAVGMIFPWRIAMAFRYRQLQRSLTEKAA